MNWFNKYKTHKMLKKISLLITDQSIYPTAITLPLDVYSQLVKERDQARSECKLYKEKYFALFEHYQQDLAYEQNFFIFFSDINI